MESTKNQHASGGAGMSPHMYWKSFAAGESGAVTGETLTLTAAVIAFNVATFYSVSYVLETLGGRDKEPAYATEHDPERQSGPMYARPGEDLGVLERESHVLWVEITDDKAPTAKD